MMTDEEAVTTAINEIESLRKQLEELLQHHTDKQEMCIECEAALAAMTKERDEHLKLTHMALDERDEYLKQLDTMALELQKRDKCSYIGPMRDCPTHGESAKLAAAQAQIAKLREALEENYALAANLMSVADEQVVAEYTEAKIVLPMGEKALALPQDTTALDELTADANKWTSLNKHIALMMARDEYWDDQFEEVILKIREMK